MATMNSVASKRPFVELVFQADMNRFEDEEFDELARKNCNEDPETRSQVIEELRAMIYKRGLCRPRRMDDAYLLRFLRSRKFIPALAHKLMYKYEQFRKSNAYVYDCDVFGLQNVKNVFAGVVPDSPEHGRITLTKLGKWDVEAFTKEDLVRCAAFMYEFVSMQPRMQILGITHILDLDGMSLRQLRLLMLIGPSQVVALCGESFPLSIHKIHVINYGYFLNSIFYFIKPFVPAYFWNRVLFHPDLNSLYKHIDPEYLPEEYGGKCGESIRLEEWIAKVYKYKDDFLVREFRELGFTVYS